MLRLDYRNNPLDLAYNTLFSVLLGIEGIYIPDPKFNKKFPETSKIIGLDKPLKDLSYTLILTEKDLFKYLEASIKFEEELNKKNKISRYFQTVRPFIRADLARRILEDIKTSNIKSENDGIYTLIETLIGKYNLNLQTILREIKEMKTTNFWREYAIKSMKEKQNKIVSKLIRHLQKC